MTDKLGDIEARGQSGVAEKQTFQQIHEARVAEITRSLFLRLDRVVADDIGFQGSILEEMFKRKIPEDDWKSRGWIEVEGMDPNLSKHVDGTGFRYKDRGLFYGVDCTFGFRSKIFVWPRDGHTERIELMVFPGTEAKRFDQIWITQTIVEPDNKFLVRDVKTFGENYRNEGETRFPDYSLVIQDRVTSQRKIEMHYGNIDIDGNVELIDGEIVGFDRFWGGYSAEEQTVTWFSDINGLPVSDQDEPNVTTNDGVLTFEYGGDKLTFPIRTNIYTVLKAAMSGVDQFGREKLPQEAAILQP